MAIKKINSKEDDNKEKVQRISYKQLCEELQLKLQESDAKISELNEKYKKVIDIQKKKVEDKYKKIIEDLQNKKSIPPITINDSAEVSRLKKKLEKLEKMNLKLEEEKKKIEIKNEELKLKAKNTLKEKNENTRKTDKDAINEVKVLKEKLLESEQEKKELRNK